MSVRTYQMTEQLRARWIADGRGQGTGANYQGWLTATDIGSEGHKNRHNERINGHLCHWLSEVEYSVAKVLQCDWSATALLDQFPIPIDDSRKIASDLGIEHPRCLHTGVDINITTDIVLEVWRNEQSLIFPFNVKMSKDLQIFNNIEHAEIERYWWKQQGWQLRFLNTDPRIIPPPLLKNATEVEQNAWIHLDKYEYLDYFDDLAARLFYHLPRYESTQTVRELCKFLDKHCGVEPGQFQRLIWNLIANRKLRANLLGSLIDSQSVEAIASLNRQYFARSGT